MLNCYVEASLGDEGRRGCLVVASAAELSTYDSDMAGMIGVALQRVETRLRDLIQLGQADGSIPSSVDADVAARALLCFLQGLRVVGKVGRSRAEMVSVADQAMRVTIVSASLPAASRMIGPAVTLAWLTMLLATSRALPAVNIPSRAGARWPSKRIAWWIPGRVARCRARPPVFFHAPEQPDRETAPGSPILALTGS